MSWGNASSSEEESRESLQTRLTAFSKLMFWSVRRAARRSSRLHVPRYPGIEPGASDIIYVISTASLAVLAAMWRAHA